MPKTYSVSSIALATIDSSWRLWRSQRFVSSDGTVQVVTPRVLAKTELLERMIGTSPETETLAPTAPSRSRRTTITEEEFYVRLAHSSGADTAERLRQFVDSLRETYGVVTRSGTGATPALLLKTGVDGYTLASIQQDGAVRFYGIVTKTAEIGAERIGIDYLNELARFVGGSVDTSRRQFWWSVKRDRSYIDVGEYLDHADKWADLIGTTIERIVRSEQG